MADPGLLNRVCGTADGFLILIVKIQIYGALTHPGLKVNRVADPLKNSVESHVPGLCQYHICAVNFGRKKIREE